MAHLDGTIRETPGSPTGSDISRAGGGQVSARGASPRAAPARAHRALLGVVLIEGGAAGGKLLASAVGQEGVDEQPPRNRGGTPPRPRSAARSANRAAS